ncbi:MAG: hypothetical protein M3135_00445 [Actinomycetota bacterium]|nr:hypothetical protein [Actinomycetota bacterium]
MRDGFDDDLEDEEEAYDYEDGELDPYRRPWWMAVVAAIVLVGLVIAAVPSFLWPWIIFFGFIGFLVWRAVAPRSPR